MVGDNSQRGSYPAPARLGTEPWQQREDAELQRRGMRP